MADNAEQVSTAEEPKLEQAPAVDAATDAPQPETVPTEPDNDSGEGEEDIKSKKVTLADLAAKGATLYAHKNYEEAAEVFARASELQAELNGETAPDNADVLFHYGRSLFRVGQSKSDVLGGAAASEKKPPAAQPANGISKATATQAGPSTASASYPSQKDDANAAIPDAKKLLFQFTGDENFDDSDDEDQEVSCTLAG